MGFGPSVGPMVSPSPLYWCRDLVGVLYKYKGSMYTNTLDVLSTYPLDTCIGHLSSVYVY